MEVVQISLEVGMTWQKAPFSGTGPRPSLDYGFLRVCPLLALLGPYHALQGRENIMIFSCFGSP